MLSRKENLIEGVCITFCIRYSFRKARWCHYRPTGDLWELEEGDVEEAGEEEADYSGWGGVQEPLWNSWEAQRGGEKLDTGCLLHQLFFSLSSFPLFPEKAAWGKRDNGERNQLCGLPAFSGRVGWRIYVVNLWKLFLREKVSYFFPSTVFKNVF